MNGRAKSPVAQALLNRHPLQRFPAPSREWSAMLHTVGLASFAYSFHHLVTTPNPINEAYGWHFSYLTIIGLTFATVTFAVGLLADLTLSSRVFLFKNALEVISAPMEVLVTILYWSLKAIDKSLVLPGWAPEPPLHTDLSFHLVPAVVLVIDLLFFSPPWTISAFPAIGVSSIIATLYWFWIEACYAHNGWFPYPIFAKLPPPYRAMLFAGSAITMSTATVLLQWLYKEVNGSEIDFKKRNERERSGQFGTVRNKRKSNGKAE